LQLSSSLHAGVIALSIKRETPITQEQSLHVLVVVQYRPPGDYSQPPPLPLSPALHLSQKCCCLQLPSHVHLVDHRQLHDIALQKKFMRDG